MSSCGIAIEDRILDLPCELRTRIFDHLLHVNDKSVLARLARCSITTHDIVIPQMYETLCFPKDNLEALVADIAMHEDMAPNDHPFYRLFESLGKAPFVQNERKIVMLYLTESVIIKSFESAVQFVEVITSSTFDDIDFDSWGDDYSVPEHDDQEVFPNLNHITWLVELFMPNDILREDRLNFEFRNLGEVFVPDPVYRKRMINSQILRVILPPELTWKPFACTLSLKN